jgi:DNA-binding CsgD family transcriptional regulator
MTVLTDQEASPLLVGRKNECEVLDAFLTATRNGEGGALAVHGDPGIGKTALLEYAVASAKEKKFEVLRTVGNEAEMELTYAALLELCRPALTQTDRLPDLQRDAIEVVFGRRDGAAPDRLLVGVALVTLLCTLSANRPLLCVIDDAQWLDTSSAQVIAFAARRVSRDAVAVILGTRTLTNDVRGLPELTISGLGDQDARTLLATVLPDRLDDRVVDRLVAETHGNPLALLELPRGSTPSQLAGGFGLPVSATLAGVIEESYRRRLAKLPVDSRRLLLIAAADPTGDSGIVWRAAEALGIAEQAVKPIEDDGLVDFGESVAFRHPLARSAVYGMATPKSRREAHLALAEATDRGVDPDRRAWHRAQATLRPDEDVATELEIAAQRAQARGGIAAAAAFLERSVALTVDPARRADRALRAAQSKRLAGALESALGLATVAQRGPLEDLQRAQLDALLGQIAFAGNRGNDAAPLMLKAASRLEQIDLKLARDTYLDALTAALFAGRLAVDATALQVAVATRAGPSSAEPLGASELLLEGLALLITDGYKSGTAVLKKAMSAFRADEVAVEERLRWLWLAGGAAGLIWDYDTWDLLTARQERLARDAGALTVLPITLSTRVGVCLFAGEIAEAAYLVDQVQVVTDASDNKRLSRGALLLAAFRGNEGEARQLIEDITKDSLARGEGLAVAMALWSKALLCNGAGQYGEAFSAATEALKNPNDLWYSGWATIELVEAASRTGTAEKAKPAFDKLVESTGASGTGWALGLQARCRALLSDGEDAEALYQEAIDRLLPTRLRFDLGRTRLLYGEWLRREQRPRDARAQLRLAHELFSEFGMEGFAQRARVELQATGEKLRKRTTGPRHDLTPQESRISELAANGATNQDIAAQMFISPATVEYHLSKVYRKLGIRSRTQLANTLLRPKPRRVDSSV